MATQTKIDMKNVTMKLKDDADEFVSVTFDDGNFTWTRNTEREYVTDRGVLDTVRDGDESPVEITFQGRYDYIKGSSPDITLYDALYQEGEASEWVSSADGESGQACAPYCVDLELINAPNCGGGLSEPNEDLLFRFFRVEGCAVDTKAGTLSITGKCNITKPIATRSAA